MNWSKATINNGTFKTSSKATSAVLLILRTAMTPLTSEVWK